MHAIPSVADDVPRAAGDPYTDDGPELPVTDSTAPHSSDCTPAVLG